MDDFSKSWKDGKAFSALIGSFHGNHKPCFEFDKEPGFFLSFFLSFFLYFSLFFSFFLFFLTLTSLFTVDMMEDAFSFAERLGIPSILTPENVIDFSDEKSIMTYISLIYKSFTGSFSLSSLSFFLSFFFSFSLSKVPYSLPSI